MSSSIRRRRSYPASADTALRLGRLSATEYDGHELLGPASRPASSEGTLSSVGSSAQRSRCHHARTGLAPENSALREAARTCGELRELGVRNQTLIINGVYHATDPQDPWATAWEQRGILAIETMPEILTDLPRIVFPLLPRGGVMGIESLRTFGDPNASSQLAATTMGSAGQSDDWPDLSTFIDELVAPGTVSSWRWAKVVWARPRSQPR